MKKTIGILISLIMTAALLCVTVSATWYTGFDILFEEKEGEKVNETKLTIKASIDDGPMIDRTGDFTLEGVEWFRYIPEPEVGKTAEDYDYVDEDLHIYGMLCTDEDVFDHEHYAYFLRIARLYAKEEDTFDRNVMINGVYVDDMNGLCFNTGNEFFIKTVTNGSHGTPDAEETTSAEAVTNPETTTDAPETETETGKAACKVCGICPIQPLGLCLFIWIAIILLIVIIVCVVLKKIKRMTTDDKNADNGK